MLPDFKMFINGEWVTSKSGKWYEVVNPGTEESIANVSLGNEEDARNAVDAARSAFDHGYWPRMTPAERGLVLWKFSDLIEKNINHLAEIEAANQGKTVRYAKETDMTGAIDSLRFFAGTARSMEGRAAGEYLDYHDGTHHKPMGTSITRREPIGVVAAIVPWNYPLLAAIWKIGPALAAGNTIVIKPASLTPLSLLELAKLVEKTDIPPGAFNVVTGPGDVIGAELARNDKVDMVAFTGSTDTGKKIMEASSSTTKKITLELGGKAPFIVFADADIDAAVHGAVAAGFYNGGQDCTAATRLYVQDDIYYTFVKKLVEETKTIKVGDQLHEKTDMGPLVSAKQLENVEAYIISGKEQGAKLMCGGKRPQGFANGFYIEPTIFIDVKHNMKICQEEIFGPVLSVMKFSTFDEAIKNANDTIYGLAASVWTKNITTAMKAASLLKFGTVWINEHGAFASEMPHGGYKQSGFGKDLSVYALNEYTKIKHVYIDLTEMHRKPWHDSVYREKQ